MKRAITTVFACVICLSLLSLADSMNLRTSSTVPGAQGRLDVSHDSNGNSSLKIEVSHLAQPSSLTPPASTYVVWVQPEGQSAEPVGILQVGEDLNGELAATTPYQKFDIFITAENSPHPQTPTGPEVMRGTVTQSSKGQ